MAVGNSAGTATKGGWDAAATILYASCSGTRVSPSRQRLALSRALQAKPTGRRHEQNARLSPQAMVLPAAAACTGSPLAGAVPEAGRVPTSLFEAQERCEPAVCKLSKTQQTSQRQADFAEPPDWRRAMGATSSPWYATSPLPARLALLARRFRQSRSRKDRTRAAGWCGKKRRKSAGLTEGEPPDISRSPAPPPFGWPRATFGSRKVLLSCSSRGVTSRVSAVMPAAGGSARRGAGSSGQLAYATREAWLRLTPAGWCEGQVQPCCNKTHTRTCAELFMRARAKACTLTVPRTAGAGRPRGAGCRPERQAARPGRQGGAPIRSR